jgi:hypothetical protein
MGPQKWKKMFERGQSENLGIIRRKNVSKRGQSVNAGILYRRRIKGYASPVRNSSGALFLTG